ncbi:type VI secretion system protein TssA [Brenneria goodwinii]|uniref:type VI secretion system protein TssA n=1 Tax=Brenneria goodwinii TaxID=1109412 RepID=UPI0036E8DF5E
MDIETFLTPVTAEKPCGENLEYDADFQAMEQASQGKTEQQFGETIIPAEPADWTKVEKLAISLLARTKDLRVMLALTHAWTKRRGLPGYADGLLLIQKALLLYWESLYPQLEEYGERDPFYRINALAALSDKSALTATLRQAKLLRNAADEITLRDALSLLDGSKTECPDYPGGRARLLDELASSNQPGIEAIQLIDERLKTICEILTERLGETGVPEMEQLRKLVSTIAASCQTTDISTLIPTRGPEMKQETLPAATVPTPRGEGDWRSAQVRSREDAQLMLEKVKQYFVLHEPSHPAPQMIERVQRLIEMNFMDIIRDLAPDGVNQLENIFGRRE